MGDPTITDQAFDYLLLSNRRTVIGYWQNLTLQGTETKGRKAGSNNNGGPRTMSKDCRMGRIVALTLCGPHSRQVVVNSQTGLGHDSHAFLASGETHGGPLKVGCAHSTSLSLTTSWNFHRVFVASSKVFTTLHSFSPRCRFTCPFLSYLCRALIFKG
jgi:hypothetical protein